MWVAGAVQQRIGAQMAHDHDDVGVSHCAVFYVRQHDGICPCQFAVCLQIVVSRIVCDECGAAVGVAAVGRVKTTKTKG